MNRRVIDRLLEWLTPSLPDEQERRRGMFLAYFCLVTFTLLAFLALTSALKGLLLNAPKHIFYAILYSLVAMLVGSLLAINRRGYVLQAVFIYLGILLVGIPLLFSNEYVMYAPLLYLIPVLVASFLLSATSTVFVATLSLMSLMITSYYSSYIKDIDSGIYFGIMLFVMAIAMFGSDRLRSALEQANKSESQYQLLLEKNPSCIYMAEGSQAGRWIYASPRIRDLLGYDAEEWLREPGMWTQHVHPNDRPKVLDALAASLRSGRPYHGEYRMLTRTGKVVWVSDDTITLHINMQMDQVQGILQDVTARKRAQQVQDVIYQISQAAYAARELTDLYAVIHTLLGQLMPAQNFFIALYDAKTDMLSFPYFVDEYDPTPGPILAGRGLSGYVLRTGKPLFAFPEKFDELLVSGEVESVGTPSVDWMGVPLILNGRSIGVMAVQSYTQGVRFTEEELTIMTFVSNQVAMVIDRKRAEAALTELNQLNSEVISGVNTGIIVTDRELNVLVWNRYVEQMTGVGPGHMITRNLLAEFPLLRRVGLDQSVEHVLAGETYQIPDMEFHIPPTHKSGWMGGYIGPHRNAQGEITGMIVVVSDLTQRKKDEVALRTALNEKEVLLREIHHRVKNNLQVMSSLISLQADTISDMVVRSYFIQMQGRVRSMALIHEELYQSHDLARVDFAEYIEKLAGGLAQTYQFAADVELVLDVKETYMGIDTAIPCGLIVNELVTNAFKYAFPAGRQGQIHIGLATHADGTYALMVADDGVGIPSDLDIENTESLGMQLVTVLTRQLHGQLHVDNQNGTSFLIEFKELKPPRRTFESAKN